MFPLGLIDIITKVAPTLGGSIGNLISSTLGGVDMSNVNEVQKALEQPASQEKLKELELQLNDLQNARANASKESPIPRLLLAVAAHIALFADIYFIEHVHNELLQQLLLMMMCILIWDIRQVFKFYFGSSSDLPSFPFMKKK
jgi:hypothetical protein